MSIEPQPAPRRRRNFAEVSRRNDRARCLDLARQTLGERATPHRVVEVASQFLAFIDGPD